MIKSTVEETIKKAPPKFPYLGRGKNSGTIFLVVSDFKAIVIKPKDGSSFYQVGDIENRQHLFYLIERLPAGTTVTLENVE